MSVLVCRSLSKFVFQTHSLPSLIEAILTDLTESTFFCLVGNSIPILVETYRRPLPSYFSSQKYSLPSLVEAVLTALAELFCLSEFIVSLRLVEAIRRPSSSNFA